MKSKRIALAIAASVWVTSFVFAEDVPEKPGAAASNHVVQERHPNASETTSWETQTQPNYRFFSLLVGVPKILELHHDTEVRTGKPIDVYMLVIEQQTMNSDGMREPIGLQFFDLFTANAVDPATAWNPANAADCKSWKTETLVALEGHQEWQPTFTYLQLAVAEGARTIETNEDGTVWWSDDIQCWGALDRFPPF
jgi:hypothetical protein